MTAGPWLDAPSFTVGIDGVNDYFGSRISGATVTLTVPDPPPPIGTALPPAHDGFTMQNVIASANDPAGWLPPDSGRSVIGGGSEPAAL